MYQLQENIDLFCRARNNLTTVLNEYVALIGPLSAICFFFFTKYHITFLWSRVNFMHLIFFIY